MTISLIAISQNANASTAPVFSFFLRSDLVPVGDVATAEAEYLELYTDLPQGVYAEISVPDFDLGTVRSNRQGTLRVGDGFPKAKYSITLFDAANERIISRDYDAAFSGYGISQPAGVPFERLSISFGWQSREFDLSGTPRVITGGVSLIYQVPPTGIAVGDKLFFSDIVPSITSSFSSRLSSCTFGLQATDPRNNQGTARLNCDETTSVIGPLPVPVPNSIALLATALGAIFFAKRIRKDREQLC
jgi:hypothetical protein